MFRKLLIANRGEIAVRIIRACRTLGITAVSVYSEADARALHVLEADEAILIGPSPAPQSYLNIRALVGAARTAGAEAVHPGYGFLSENAEFAEACQAAGLVWVGPPPAAMRAMGSKINAKRLAAELGVPLLPGYQGDDQDERVLAAAAARIDYPLLIKASAGGGGRGMRVVDDPADFRDALAAARREASAAFGDDAVLLERYVRRPRHIEIQIFGDARGNVVHLGERECSVQRRHQKVIEESPSVALTPALREEIGAAAVRLARAIGYTSAGTVEFLLDEEDARGSQYAFLEMNTRLQVEHPVTEMVTGLDLVQLQIAVAAGEPLPFTQADVQAHGHAIECRVYAEDPARNYLPSTGTLTRFTPPTGPGVRNDVGVYAGAQVPPFYDAMLAKLIVHGSDRATAIARTVAALDAYEVAGVATNLPLLRATVRHQEFAAGRTYTSFLDEHVLPTLAGASVPVEALLGAAAFDLLATERPAGDPWSAGPWRLAGGEVRLAYRHDGAEQTVLAVRDADVWALSLGEERRRVSVELLADGRILVREGPRMLTFEVTTDGEALRITHRGHVVTLERAGPPSISGASQAGALPGGPRALTAPLTGVIVNVAVEEGARVRARQPLIVIEAMKMEHVVEAPSDGVVRRLPRTIGDRVQAGDVLVEFEAG